MVVCSAYQGLTLGSLKVRPWYKWAQRTVLKAELQGLSFGLLGEFLSSFIKRHYIKATGKNKLQELQKLRELL